MLSLESGWEVLGNLPLKIFVGTNMETPLGLTPLYKEHLALGAKMIDFHGWQLPVFYPGGSLKEHSHCRESCGVFDVSHMAQIEVRGDLSGAFLQYLLPSRVAALKEGWGRYSCVLDSAGLLLDDVFLYRLSSDQYLLCVNGSRRREVWHHIKEQKQLWLEARGLSGELVVSDSSDDWALLAVQGPRSREALALFLSGEDLERAEQLAYTQLTTMSAFKGGWVARTGYTGEWGYEVFVPCDQVLQIWRTLVGSTSWLQPMGLGARDSLRLEAGFLLYGSDIHPNLTPYDVNLQWLLCFEEGDFVGRCALEKLRESREKQSLIGFLMQDRGMARAGMDVYIEREDTQGSSMECVGTVSSGGYLPTLRRPGGLARVRVSEKFMSDGPKDLKEGKVSAKDIYSGRRLWIDIRGKKCLAQYASLPFYVSKARG